MMEGTLMEISGQLLYADQRSLVSGVRQSFRRFDSPTMFIVEIQHFGGI